MHPENENRIELGSGRLYFGGEEPVEVNGGEVENTDDVWEDELKLCTISSEPFTFECEAEFNRDWTTVKCRRCRYEFPVTQLYALLLGTEEWTCPLCQLEEAINDAKKRSNE